MSQPQVVAGKELVGPLDLSDEAYREYEVLGTGLTYRISDPISLWYRDGGSTHRVLDSTGVVHCVAYPASLKGIPVVLRWQPRPALSLSKIFGGPPDGASRGLCCDRR